MGTSKILKKEIDLPQVLNMSISKLPDYVYPPRILINFSETDPGVLAFDIQGLTEKVTFTVSSNQNLEEKENVTVKTKKEKLTKAAHMKQPSLKTLSHIKWRKDRREVTFRLVDRVSAQWRDFGAHLDIAESKLDEWEDRYDNEVDKCWKKVMNYWLERKGSNDEYPVTWEGLYKMLEDLQYPEVAKELEKAVNSVKL